MKLNSLWVAQSNYMLSLFIACCPELALPAVPIVLLGMFNLRSILDFDVVSRPKIIIVIEQGK